MCCSFLIIGEFKIIFSLEPSWLHRSRRRHFTATSIPSSESPIYTVVPSLPRPMTNSGFKHILYCPILVAIVGSSSRIFTNLSNLFRCLIAVFDHRTSLCANNLQKETKQIGNRIVCHMEKNCICIYVFLNHKCKDTCSNMLWITSDMICLNWIRRADHFRNDHFEIYDLSFLKDIGNKN